LRGFIGLKEVEIPAGIFLSTPLISALSSDGKSFWDNEIKLPNGDLVVGVSVSWVGEISSVIHPHSTDPDDVIREWLVLQYQQTKHPLKGNDKALSQECRKKFSLSWRQYISVFKSLDKKYRYSRGHH
jgi:hypothetical protein